MTPTPDIPALEQAIWQAVADGNVAALARMLAADFEELGRSGRRYSRADTLGGADQQRDFGFHLHDPACRMLTPGTALLTYVSEVRYPDGTQWANRCTIWTCDGQDWQIRYHQGTPIDAPKGAV